MIPVYCNSNIPVLLSDGVNFPAAIAVNGCSAATAPPTTDADTGKAVTKKSVPTISK